MKKKIMLLTAFALITFMAAHGNNLAMAAEPISIGVIGSLTGPDTDVNGMSYGCRDYFKYMNDKYGGFMGHPIKCTLLDGKNQVPEEVKAFKRLVDLEKVVLIDGWGTGGTKALRDQVNKLVKITYLSDSLSIEVVDPVNLPYNFVLGPTYEDQIKIGLSWAKQKGAKTAVLLHNDVEYGKGPVRNIMNEKFPDKIGIKILGTVEYPWVMTEVTPQLLRIKEMNPDFIYIQDSANNTTTILRDAAKVGVPASKFIANNWNSNPVIPKTLGDKAEGFHPLMIFADFGFDIPVMREILEFGKTNEIPKKDRYYVRGWTKGKINLEAIRRVLAKTGGKLPPIDEFRKRIRDEWEAIDGFDVGGAVPPVSFKNHQGTTFAVINEVKKGRFEPITPPIDSKKF